MQRSCDVCGVTYEAKRPNAKFCSDTCRKRHQRGARKPERPEVAPVADIARSIGEIEESTAAALDETGRLETPLGRTALRLARRLDDPERETGQGLASLAKQFEAVFTSATAGVDVEDDPIDELRAARDRKRRANAG